MNRKYSAIKWVFAIVPLFLFARCINLDENLTGQPTAEKFFKTEEDFKSFMTGAYSTIIHIYGMDDPYIACAGAEDISTTVVPWKGFEYGNINLVGNPDQITDNIWNYHFTSISSCNTLLQIISVSTFDPAMLLAYEGEARFIRAFCYFNLVRWFGSIPLLTEENQANAAVEPQSSVADIYALIVGDLQKAETALPDVQENNGRPTKLAAKALLSKVYLTMAGFPLNQTANYALARDKAWEVISSGKFELEPVFGDLWLWANRYTNTESIFSLHSSADAGTGGYVNRAIRPSDGSEGGWGDFNSDKRFLASFPVGDGSRLNGTFYLTTIDGLDWSQTTNGEPYIGKLRDGGPRTGGYSGPPQANTADGSYIMIRLADILLVYAEAANLAEGSPSAEAYKAVNRVRSRAGLPNLENLSSTAFDKAVLDERNWELAFECNRWFDIVRRKLLTQVIAEYYPEQTIDDHNYLLPKPYGQLSIMTGLVQNPGYRE